jgi:hypothetical protein
VYFVSFRTKRSRRSSLTNGTAPVLRSTSAPQCVRAYACVLRVDCRIKLYLVKAAPAAPLAPRQRPAPPLEARPAHAGPHAQSTLIKVASGRLRSRLSSSRPRCSGRSLRSRRIRSASPNLDQHPLVRIMAPAGGTEQTGPHSRHGGPGARTGATFEGRGGQR